MCYDGGISTHTKPSSEERSEAQRESGRFAPDPIDREALERCIEIACQDMRGPRLTDPMENCQQWLARGRNLRVILLPDEFLAFEAMGIAAGSWSHVRSAILAPPAADVETAALIINAKR